MPANKFKVFGLFLLIAATGSQALTLGRLRGVALVGQALDVAVQVRMDADQSPANQCFAADVFHADTRQEPSRVQVSVVPAQGAQAFNVRVQSAGLVDEPVVTVYLYAGCTQKISRRYVLLADVVSEQIAPAAPSVSQVPVIVPVPAVAPATRTDTAGSTRDTAAASAGTDSAATTRAATASAGRRTQRPRPAARGKAVAAVRKPAKTKAATASVTQTQSTERLAAGRAAGQSRLKLDPLEVLSERVATLESTTASAPAEVVARESREVQRIESLEASLKNLLALAARNESSLSEMQARLRQAESDRYRNPLVYGLAVLLLIALLALGLLARRLGRRAGDSGGNWWSGTAGGFGTAGSPETGPGSVRPSGFSTMSAPGALASQDAPTQQMQRAGPRSLPGPVTQVDVSLVEMSESTFDRLMQSGATHSAVRKPRSVEAPGTAPAAHRRSINSEELFDIRQQAEFFVSLGQTDQAVRILENRINESGESSPLAYLDLLRIFHSLGLRADFRQVREDFGLLFNARVPEFSNFADEGRSLEEYPEVVGAIAASWGTPNVFATMEASLFRDQPNAQHEPFDLAAFRDLLLLHAVAQAVASSSDRPSIPAALNAAYSPAATQAATTAVPGGMATRPVVPSAGKHGDVALPIIEGASDLDIDLSDLHIPRETPAMQKTAREEGVPGVPPDTSNLIDFDLSQTSSKFGPTGR